MNALYTAIRYTQQTKSGEFHSSLERPRWGNRGHADFSPKAKVLELYKLSVITATGKYVSSQVVAGGSLSQVLFVALSDLASFCRIVIAYRMIEKVNEIPNLSRFNTHVHIYYLSNDMPNNSVPYPTLIKVLPNPVQCSAPLLVAGVNLCVVFRCNTRSVASHKHKQLQRTKLSTVVMLPRNKNVSFYSPYVTTLEPVRRRETTASFTATIPAGTR